MPVSTAAVGTAGIGALFLYAGIKGLSIPAALQGIIQGKAPATAAKAAQIPIAADIAAAASSAAGSTTLGPGAGTGTTVTGGGSAQAIMQQTAAQFGWGTGAQWQALSNLEMQEAGFNPNARNPSGAYGLAQSLGHPQFGYPEYGGYGLTQAQVAAANHGDAAAQSLWMMRYIASIYGNPVNAWAHEQSHNWY